MRVDISGIEKILEKLKRKDPAMFRAIQKKIDQIAGLDESTIRHFKNLRGDISDFKRVHVKKSFVLMFHVKGDTVIFRRLRHHDKAY